MMKVYFFTSFIYWKLFVVVSFFTKKFLCMIVKYFIMEAIHVKDFTQLRNFLLKCRPVATNNKCSVHKASTVATFSSPRSNCKTIEDSLGVRCAYLRKRSSILNKYVFKKRVCDFLLVYLIL